MVKSMEPILNKMQLGAGYDSFQIHADVWYTFKVHPLIDIRENAVQNTDGNESEKTNIDNCRREAK